MKNADSFIKIHACTASTDRAQCDYAAGGISGGVCPDEFFGYNDVTLRGSTHLDGVDFVMWSRPLQAGEMRGRGGAQLEPKNGGTVLTLCWNNVETILEQSWSNDEVIWRNDVMRSVTCLSREWISDVDLSLLFRRRDQTNQQDRGALHCTFKAVTSMRSHHRYCCFAGDESHDKTIALTRRSFIYAQGSLSETLTASHPVCAPEKV